MLMLVHLVVVLMMTCATRFGKELQQAACANALSLTVNGCIASIMLDYRSIDDVCLGLCLANISLNPAINPLDPLGALYLCPVVQPRRKGEKLPSDRLSGTFMTQSRASRSRSAKWPDCRQFTNNRACGTSACGNRHQRPAPKDWFAVQFN